MPSLLIFHTVTKEVLTCLPAATNNAFDPEKIVRGHGKDPADYSHRFLEEPITTSKFKASRYVNASNQVERMTELLPQITEGQGLSTISFSTTDDLIINIDGTDYTVEADSTGQAVIELESTVPATFSLRANQRTYRLKPIKVSVL